MKVPYNISRRRDMLIDYFCSMFLGGTGGGCFLRGTHKVLGVIFRKMAAIRSSVYRKMGCHPSGFILQALEWATAAGACPNTLPHLCAQG